ncbi:MAG: chemotaxis protein CheD [Leptonema sp. (in: bacteria)]
MINNTTIFLNPGEVIISKDPTVIKTVLGSCVAVTLYDKKNKRGGMCHFLLPNFSQSEVSTKYGSVAIPLLIKKFLEMGTKKNNLESKVFGGASVLLDEKEIFFIGDRNIELAIRLLKEYSIPIKEMQVGGETGKIVFFYTDTGQTILKDIKKMSIKDLYNPTL